MQKPYRSDLTDAQWELIRPLLPPAKSGGRPRSVDLREVVNTLFYQARSGCPWDYLPHDLAAKGTVWDYFVAWHGYSRGQQVQQSDSGRVATFAGGSLEPKERMASGGVSPLLAAKNSQCGTPTKRHYASQ